MMPAAPVMPVTPNGAKSAKLSVFQPVMPMTTNITSTAILMTTMIALTVADSLAPRMSSSAHSVTSTTAGRLSTPPPSGDWERTSGIRNPNRLPSSWLRYCDQPTATAADDTPYSSSRHAATPMATTSPSVA
jgi:hypothetical protein